MEKDALLRDTVAGFLGVDANAIGPDFPLIVIPKRHGTFCCGTVEVPRHINDKRIIYA